MARGTKASRYLRLLSQHYPSIEAASKAIIDLTAQLSLPKGTEHFLSDVHGEYEAFNHVLRSGSGSIRRRIDEIFGHTLTESERCNLATLITYPEQKVPLILRTVDDEGAWYRDTLQQLLKVCRSVISKYPRDHVQAALPHPAADIIEELLYAQEDVEDKRDYYRRIIEIIIATDSGGTFIVALADLIQRLAIARLHVVGDIYDRGPGAHRIMDLLIDYQDVDVQWGNHDILWMGAAAGSEACIANVIRFSCGTPTWRRWSTATPSACCLWPLSRSTSTGMILAADSCRGPRVTRTIPTTSSG